MVETPKLVLEAFASGLTIDQVIVPSDVHPDPEIAEQCEANGVRLFGLAPDAFTSLSDARTPQPALAVVEIPSLAIDDRFRALTGFVLVLVDVADPGNVGTLIRTAEAAGASGVIATTETADVISPKVVRASAGSILRVPVAEVDRSELMDTLASLGVTTVGTDMSGEPYETLAVGPDESIALLLGNEAHGLDASILDRVDRVVSIPMAGSIESLNVATAGAVLAFDHARRLRGRTP